MKVLEILVVRFNNRIIKNKTVKTQHKTPIAKHPTNKLMWETMFPQNYNKHIIKKYA